MREKSKPHFTWLVWPRGVGDGQFFDTQGWFAILQRNQATGNSVKVGDGRATVTGYKFPRPLVGIDWEGGNKIRSPKSGYRLVCARPDPVETRPSGPALQGQLLRQREG